MSKRSEINQRSRAVGIDPSAYANDSKLEQRVIYEENNLEASTGTLGVGTLTMSDVPTDADTMTIGSQVYTFVDDLTEAIAAQTLTTTGTFSDGEVIGIGDRTYTMKTTLSTSPTVANEILIGANAAASLDNLKVAIDNGATEGTNYSTDTAAHADVTATTNGATTQIVTFRLPGVAGNGVTVSTTAANASWGAPNLAGGVNPIENEIHIESGEAEQLDLIKEVVNGTESAVARGTDYSTGTDANPHVTATTNGDTTQVVAARSNAENGTATTESADNTSWGAATLASDVADVDASSATDAAMNSGGARV